MNIMEIARTPVLTAPPESSVQEVAGRMAAHNVGAIAVTGLDGKLLGIFTERDNLVRVTAAGRDSGKTTLLSVMSRPVETTVASATVEQALEQMMRRRIRHLPVVDAHGHVAGMVSLRYALLERLSAKSANIETLLAYVEAGGPG